MICYNNEIFFFESVKNFYFFYFGVYFKQFNQGFVYKIGIMMKVFYIKWMKYFYKDVIYCEEYY